MNPTDPGETTNVQDGSVLIRSPISSIPIAYLDPIQRGTLNYTWKGIPCLKNPFDLALYTQLFWDVRPGTIFEIGSNAGGSAVWFGDMLDSLGIGGRIISIDIERPESVSHPRVEFRKGDGLKLWEVLPDEEMRALPRPFLVIEDAAHAYEVTRACMAFFDKWLHAGEFMCIEDGIISTFEVEARYNGGPDRAITEFLSEHPGEYEIATEICDRFGYNVTWNTNGYLRRIGRNSAETAGLFRDQRSLDPADRETRYGDQRATIAEVVLYDAEGRRVGEINSLEQASIKVRIDPHSDVPDAVLGFIVRNERGVEVYGLDSLQAGHPAQIDMKANQPVYAIIDFRNVLAKGTYTLTLAIAESNGTKLDVRMDAFRFKVRDDTNFPNKNIANLEASFAFEKTDP